MLQRLTDQLQQHVTFVHAFKGLVQQAPKETELKEFDKLSIGIGHTNTMNKRACVGMGVTTPNPKSESAPSTPAKQDGNEKTASSTQETKPKAKGNAKAKKTAAGDSIPRAAASAPQAKK